MDKHLHDLIDDKAIWSRFFKSLNAKKVSSKKIPYYKNHFKYFLSKAQNTPIEKLSS